MTTSDYPHTNAATLAPTSITKRGIRLLAMRTRILVRVLLSGVLGLSYAVGHSAVQSVTYDLEYGGGGYLSSDPPPAGFYAEFSSRSPIVGTFEYDDTQGNPIGPYPQDFALYGYFNVTRISVSWGDWVFESQIPVGILSPSITSGYGIPSGINFLGATVSETPLPPIPDYPPRSGVFPLSGPSVLGLEPWVIGFSMSLPIQTDAAFPSLDTLRDGQALFSIGFRTPSGNNVNVFANAPVPEPATYLLILIGLALVGLLVHRRRGALSQANATMGIGRD